MGMQDENALVLFIPVYLGSVRLCFVMDGSCYSCLGVSENKEQVPISYCFICCIHDRGPFEHSTFSFFLYWTCLASRTRRPACQQAAVIVGDWRYSGKPWRGLQLWFPRSPPQRVGETERRGLYSSVIIVGMTMKRIKLCWAVVWGASEPLFRVHLKIIP